ncbi:MAG: type I-E CRISPR-associated protein Cas5/CasD [bacterium]
MATLLIRLSAPMQSWGISSRFTERDTIREPTKSGVIGLLCAALGWTQDHELSSFLPDNMLMGVRVDREGIVKRDYHITQKVIKSKGGAVDTVVSNRYYLADAEFLVGLQSDNIDFLLELKKAIENPKFPLFLGRKAFPPSIPIIPTEQDIGFENPTNMDLETALTSALFTKRYGEKTTPKKIRLVIELHPNDPRYLSYGIVRTDQPLSFEKREFMQRRVEIKYYEPTLKKE